MVKNRKNGARAEFGEGDIHVFSMYTERAGIGYLLLENLDEPHKIGELSNDYIERKYGGRILDEESIPIIMSFSKIESIDAVIAQLEVTRECMIRGKVLNPISECTWVYEEE